jgi:hypothetical protein
MSEKLSEGFSTRIPLSMKAELERCSPDEMVQIHHGVRVNIAKFLHGKKFDPNAYGLNSIVENQNE